MPRGPGDTGHIKEGQMVKSKIIEKDREEPKPEWPKLMSGLDGLVVLFSEPKSGTVVIPNPHNGLSYHYEGWDMAAFKPFTDKVVLENV